MNEKELLAKLLGYFYEDNGNLFWGYKEMYGLKDIAPQLNADLLAWIAKDDIELKI